MLVSDILKSKGSSVKMVRSYDTAMSCAQRLKTERVGALVVSDDGRSLDGDRIAGIVSTGDVLKYRLEEMQMEANVLHDVVVAAR